MLIKTRSKLAKFRRRPGPVSSLADFILWTMRNALHPARPKTWLVILIIAGGLASAALLPQFRTAIMWLVCGFGVMLLIMLMLSYLRTMMAVHAETLSQGQERMTEKLNRAQAGLAVARSVTGAASPDSHRVAEQAFERLVDSEIMDAFVQEFDALRLRIECLERSRASIDEIAALKADLRSLGRRTDWRLRTDAEAITRLSGHLTDLSGAAANGFSKTS